MKTVTNLTNQIYDAKLSDRDCGDILRSVHQSLDEMFYEEAPNKEQQDILLEILKLSKKVDGFLKAGRFLGLTSTAHERRPIAKANAHLIAAAPEMLEALEHVLPLLEVHENGAWGYAKAMVTQVINKAKGSGE